MTHTPPIRIQRRRTKGFNLQAQSPDGRPVVSVCRPGKWGNPFKIGEKYANGTYLKIETVSQAVEAFEAYLSKYPRKDISELRGKHLACFCPIGQPCHADILLKLANKPV